MVGIVLRFTGTVRNTIREMLNLIDLSNKCIDVTYWESYGSDTCAVNLNDYLSISEEEICTELIVKDNKIYPEFVELFIRDKNKEKVQIETYSSFINSNYVLSMIIIDYHNIEICCKNEEYLLQIISNFEKSKLENKKLIVLNKIDDNAILKAWRLKDDKSIYDL